jgi:phosphatidate cytidylyltransferase
VLTAVTLLVVAVACYLGGPAWFFWLVAVVVSVALLELLDAARQSGRKVMIPFGGACGFALMAAAYWRPRDAELLVVVAGATVLGAFLLALRPGRGATPASDVAWTVLGVAWIAGGGAAAVSVLTLDGGLNLLVAALAVIAVDDIAAYFVGVRFGKHRLVPSISPAKSWEGFAAGLVAALCTGGIFGALLDELNVLEGVAAAAIVGLLAPAGDLAESMAKRELGIKDSGRLLPGHGGFLDRIDAMLFCAPAVLLYLRAVVS